MHEYVLCYAKNVSELDDLELNPDPRVVERYYKYKDSKFDTRGPYRLKPLEATKSMGERKNLIYAIPLPDGGEVWPKKQWWWQKSRTLKALANDEIVFTKSKGGVSVSYKQYLKDEEGEERGAKLFSIIDGIYTQEGTSDLKQVFDGQLVLQFPKPVRLIKKLLELATEGDDIVLDSFAGSGTTGQAVLELNKEDGGNRAVILVQMPYDSKDNEKEKFNVCRQITAERMRRVMIGYKFTGTEDETLLEENVTLTLIKNSEDLLARIDEAKAANSQTFDDIFAECKNGVVRVIGMKSFEETKPGLGGSFVYSRLGRPLFGEYRSLGKHLPPYEELAKYIFFTETSRDFDPKWIEKNTGKIGEYRSTSYYLLYTPNDKEDRALNLAWLKSVEKTEKKKNLVVYCEKIWIHRDDLAKYEAETNRKIRPMLVPFHLK